MILVLVQILYIHTTESMLPALVSKMKTIQIVVTFAQIMFSVILIFKMIIDLYPLLNKKHKPISIFNIIVPSTIK